MLYCWGLLVQRAKVLKYLSSAASLQVRGVEFVTECTKCKRTTLGPSCQNCKKPLLTCTLCRLPVRGAANACLNCGHGGHTDHLRKWFAVCFFKNLIMVILNFSNFRNTMYVHLDAAATVLNKVLC